MTSLDASFIIVDDEKVLPAPVIQKTVTESKSDEPVGDFHDIRSSVHPEVDIF